MWIAGLVVLGTAQVTGSVTADGGDYVDIPFTVPANTVEIEIARTYDTTAGQILDFGVWQPEGYRGWSGGLTDDIIVGVDQSTRGYLPGTITPAQWTLVVGKARLDPSGNPTNYTVTFTFRDNATLQVLPKANYAPMVLATGQRWYRGDFHVHSTQSGDTTLAATPDDDIALAAANGLDFIHMSDHNTVAQLALSAASQPQWPVLVLRGSEITTYSGHGNGVGISEYVDHRIGYNDRTIQQVVDDVVAQGGIFLVNHPAENLGAQCIGCFWDHMDDTPWDEVSGIEVLTAGWEIGVTLFTPMVLQMWDMLEDAGHRLAAVGGSDDHRAGTDEGSTPSEIGNPCVSVLASELSEQAILAGVKARHTIVQLRGCSDAMVDATMAIPGGGAAQVGDEVDGVELADITVHVTHGDGQLLQLWRDGKQLDQRAVSGDDAVLHFEDTPGAAQHRYRIHLVDANSNEPIVITSHFYVSGIAGAGGCASGGSPGMLAALFVAGAFVRRRRAR
jgi:MYXO-CTERM domain-containing protein